MHPHKLSLLLTSATNKLKNKNILLLAGCLVLVDMALGIKIFFLFTTVSPTKLNRAKQKKKTG
jgi:hypothetical protein